MKYGSSMTAEDIHDRYLPNRSVRSIASKKSALGSCSGRLSYVNNGYAHTVKPPNDTEIMMMVEKIMVGAGRVRKDSWTADELFYLIKYYNTMSCEELHDKYLKDRSPQAICIKAGKIDVSGFNIHWTDELDQLVIDKYNAGLSSQDIADFLNVGYRSVEQRIHHLKSGDKNSQISLKKSKYTPEEDATLLYTARFLSFEKISESILVDRSYQSLYNRYMKLMSGV